MTKKIILNTSLRFSRVSMQNLDAAVEKVQKLTGDRRFSKSELVCDCLSEAIVSVLKSKGLTPKQIDEVLK